VNAPREAPGWLTGRAYWLMVAGVLCLAAALRFYRLGDWSLWVDEGMTYLRASTGQLSDQGPMYSTAPLNFLVTRWVILLASPTPFWLRFFPALCGIAGVGAIIWAGTRLAGRRAGVVAGLLLALSAWHIEWSQNARHFSVAFLFMTLALGAFFAYWESGKAGWLALSCFATGLGLATHSSSAFALVSMGAYAVTLALLPRFRAEVVTRGKIIGTISAFVLIAAVYVPIVLVVSAYLGEHKPAWNSPANVAGSIAFYAGPLPLFLGVAVGVVESNAGRRGALLALQWLVWPIALAVLAATRTISSNAYALVSLGGLVILLGIGVDRLMAEAGPARIVGLILLGGLVAEFGAGTWLYFTSEQGNRPPWREAAAWVMRVSDPRDPVYATEGIAVGYYLKNLARARWLDQWQAPGAGETQWLLVLGGRTALPESPLKAYLDRQCILRQVFYRNSGPKRRDIEAYRCGP